MKILYVITKSEAGGAQTHVLQMARCMKSLGHEVGVSAYPGGWLEDEIKKLGCSFFSNNFLRHTLNLCILVKAGKRVNQIVEEFGPDLVSAHSTVAGIVARLAIRNNVPTIFTAHGWGFAKGSPWYRKPITIPPERLMSRYAKKIICVSNQDKDIALKYGIVEENKLIVVHNGVEVSTVTPVLHHMNSEKVHIVFVGRLAPPKNPFLLIDAFTQLPDDVKRQAEITIVGEGPLRESAERYVKSKKLSESISFKGALARDDVFKVYGRSDIFVLVSNWEGFPRSVLEAMAFGLPVIASDVGGVKEAVSGDIGVILPKGKESLGVLTEALDKLIKNPKLRQRLGKQARVRAETLFSLEAMYEKTYEVYESVL